MRLAAWRAALRPGDLLLLTLGLALLAGLWQRQAGSLEGRVVIRLDGRIHQEASLRLNRIIEVTGPLGTSRVEIRDGRVRVAADPSPRQLCVRQGWIPPGGGVVCLPNRVSVENAAAGYDTLNY
ncbi:MAG: NusG domain II-containing protein [Pseudomonadota bacterium]